MSRERAKILKMVAEGTITPEDAEKLLGRLDPAPTAVAVMDGPAPRTGTNLKFLRVLVQGDEDHINIRVPISLIRTGIKLTTLIPLAASEHLKEHGIDFSEFNQLDEEELMEALRELQVDITGSEGESIRIFCE